MLNIKHFWWFFFFFFSIKLFTKTHWYDYIHFVMLKGLCQKFTFWILSAISKNQVNRAKLLNFEGKPYKSKQNFYYTTNRQLLF